MNISIDFSTWIFTWWCQFVDKFETRPSSLRNSKIEASGNGKVPTNDIVWDGREGLIICEFPDVLNTGFADYWQ